MAENTTPVVPHGAETDPTPMVTQLVFRESAAVREFLTTYIKGEVNTIVARLDGNDKAIELLQRYPTDVDKAMRTLKEQHETKFDGVADQLANNKDAVATALASAKEAVSKSDANTSERLKAIESLISSAVSGTSSQMTDVKERLTRIESSKSGGDQVWGVVAAIISSVVAVGAVIVSLVVVMSRDDAPVPATTIIERRVEVEVPAERRTETPARVN